MSKNRRKNFRATVKSPTIGPGATQQPVQPSTYGTGGPDRVPIDSRGASQSKYNRDQIPPPGLDTSSLDPDNWFSPFQPVMPFGPPNSNYIRDWDYRTGINIDFVDGRLPLYAQLRAMSRSWGVLRSIIETRKDQMLRVPWEIQLVGDPRGVNDRVTEMRNFFRRPDGKRTFNVWARLLLENVLVTDTPAVYVGHRDRRGRPLSAHVIDGATIKVLIDDAGTIPDYPNPAYQQIIKGLPMNNFDERELIFSPMRPLPEYPIYGYSPVEQIYIEITEAIRKTMYQLKFWTEGSLPDMLMSVPKDWTIRQIASFQAFFDAELAGNLTKKSQVRFVPDGMKPYDIKNSSGESLHSQRDELLIRLACYAFSVSPQPFIREMNRATAQTAQETSEQEGQQTLQQWFAADIMNIIIQDPNVGFGYDDVHFVWLPPQETDQLKRAQVHQIQVKAGIATLNEVRDELGRLPVEGGDEILIYTNNGVMTLSDAIAAGKAQNAQNQDALNGKLTPQNNANGNVGVADEGDSDSEPQPDQPVDETSRDHRIDRKP